MIVGGNLATISAFMKILHVIESLGGGGAERQLLSLTTNLSNERFSHIVCCLRPPDFFAPILRRRGHRVIELGLSGRYPWPKAAVHVHRMIREHKPDVVQTMLYDANVSTRFALLFQGQPPIVTSL